MNYSGQQQHSLSAAIASMHHVARWSLFPTLTTLVDFIHHPRWLMIFSKPAASEDHSRALRASTDRLPVDWRRTRGRPIESDLKPLNHGLHSALRRATDRPSWRRIVETTMLFERATWWWRWSAVLVCLPTVIKTGGAMFPSSYVHQV